MSDAATPERLRSIRAEPKVMRGRLVVTEWKVTPPPWADEVPQRLSTRLMRQEAIPLDYEPPPFILP